MRALTYTVPRSWPVAKDASAVGRHRVWLVPRERRRVTLEMPAVQPPYRQRRTWVSGGGVGGVVVRVLAFSGSAGAATMVVPEEVKKLICYNPCVK
jgi:hypothetical protein